MDKVTLKGLFSVRLIRQGLLVAERNYSNTVVTAGKNAILDTMFNATVKATWYGGLIDSITTISNNDTMSSHAGWTEFSNYDEATRPTYNPDNAASGNIINPLTATMSFTINDTTDPTLVGGFICNDDTPGGTSGTLWSVGAFSSPLATVNDDVIEMRYSLTVL